MICFQISIFEPLETTHLIFYTFLNELWFAFKLVSLNHWKQLRVPIILPTPVVICFQISIFEPLETTHRCKRTTNVRLWFAFKLVSLNHWKQLPISSGANVLVVICFQISIFDTIGNNLLIGLLVLFRLWFAFKLVSLIPLETTVKGTYRFRKELWFAFKLVSLIPLETTLRTNFECTIRLWFAFKLVSLIPLETTMVLCTFPLVLLWFAFKLVSLIPLETTKRRQIITDERLWFAFKLVSLIPLETTYPRLSIKLLKLWFAFKLVSLIPLETTLCV